MLLEPGVPVPPLLRSRSRLAHDQLDQLIDAIYGRSSKPAVGPPRTASQQRRFVIRLCSMSQQEIAISAELDGALVAAEQTVRLGAGFYFSYADFLHSRLPGARRPLEAISADRARELQSLGDSIGQVLFHGEIGPVLTDAIKRAAAASEEIELTVETADPQLLAIPFETGRLADGRVPALESGVRMVRRLAGSPEGHFSPQPGPLKILVAVGAPDEGTTPNAVLDMERELQSILDAVEKARVYGNAYVRILNVGSLDEIRRALQEQSYHVLHLSGHGNAGVLDLEDEDGHRAPVTAGELANAIRDSGNRISLVFLASCLSGAGNQETASLAQGLLQQNVPAVMAMQTSVTDTYATQLAAAFYANLASSERPLASRALALARQQLERDRRKALERGEHAAPEYGTASLFLLGAETPILDWSLDLALPKEQGRKPSSGAVPMLDLGDLIGRREELRSLMRVLTDDQRSISAIGRKAGCQVVGIGGVGKSALVGRAMARLAGEGWTCVAVTGQLTLGKLAAALSAGLLLCQDKELKEIGSTLATNLPDNVRLPLICDLLAQRQLLLVLDNFEDNLALGGDAFLDPALAQVMQLFYRSAQRGKVLITSRYPLPDASDSLATQNLGPLTDAQTRKLLLRLSKLRTQQAEGLQLIRRAIGGHPRMLEYLDAILKRGQARSTDVTRRLREQAAKQGMNLEDASSTLDTAVRAALQVGAGDILLDELLELASEHEGDPGVLYQAAVFPRPVSVEGLASCLTGSQSGEAVDGGAGDSDCAKTVERLTQMSLLASLPNGAVWVHRWTAEALRDRIPPEVYRECCRRGGEYLTSDKRSVVQALEATRLFLAAQEFDRATDEGVAILQFLKTYGQVADLAAVAREIAHSIPEDHSLRYVFLAMEADALRQLGMTDDALAQHRRVIELLEKRVRAYPDHANFQRDLSVSYNKVGDLMRSLGQGEQARSYFQKALEVRERLAAQEPDRADFQRDLCVSYSRMGDLMQGLGQGQRARVYFQKDLDIAERLATQEPDRANFQRDLSFSYGRMGDLMRYLGQDERAHTYFQKALEIGEHLAAQEADRVDFQRDVCISYERMGDLMQSLGQEVQARTYFQKALEVRERLAAQEPDRVDLLHELSVPYNKMGDLMLKLGQGEQARVYFQKDLDIAERLVVQEPDRADFQRDLSVSYNTMGDLMLMLGHGEQAHTYFHKALDIAERLAAQEPDRADLQTDIVVSLWKINNRPSLERALRILRRLDEEQKLAPDKRGWIPGVEAALQKLGG
ncbi:MAG TPA: CHAT domain-containing protein [Gemmataceae bacterium]|nr:CHAT domain-containing protein [Gemmataceae bacterium]